MSQLILKNQSDTQPLMLKDYNCLFYYTATLDNKSAVMFVLNVTHA